MTARLSILLLFLVPFTLLGQAYGDSSNKISTKEIYSIIQRVIQNEKLKKKYGLEITPEKYCNFNQDDASYLQTLLIKPTQPDTIQHSGSPDTIETFISYPDKNILTPADIEYILNTKENFKDFSWDNNRLKFNLKRRDQYYTFSVPYFNLAHDKVIVMYEFHCPGLCGGGSTILLTRTDKGWNYTYLQIWVN